MKFIYNKFLKYIIINYLNIYIIIKKKNQNNNLKIFKIFKKFAIINNY